ncbi:MAG: DUF1553 domain-containing protein, partial [Candidatus Hydrogenedentes bacterium]|nr:DUF1553 domain-containing protein [Candidatus Hydrogenedentota bacterium]
LLRERQHLQRRLRDIDAVRSAAKSPELEQVDKDLAAVHDQVAAVESTQRSPSNGYHSAVSARQDAIKWVQIDLGGPAVANKIVLVAARPIDFPDTKGFGFPHRFRIEASADPNFTEAILLDDKSQEDFPNPRDKRYEVDGPPVPVQYIRVTATKLWQCTNDYIFALAEILVEGEKGALTANAVVSALDTIEQGRWSTRFLLDGYDSRQRLDMTPEAFAQLAALKEEEQKLVAAREQMLDQALDPGMRGWQRLPEIQAALEAMPQPDLVYAAASDYAPIGAFAPPPGVRPVFVLKRGDVNQPADGARPGALACVEGLQAIFELADAQDEAERRAALARWIAAPENCLTWRSIVNRVWHYHFGKGIVETPNDFGHMGAPPTHPELLDWLALEFLDHGQSLKWLHKLIVTSAAYRQVSADNPANAAKDSSNRFLWRMNRRQLDVESLRDAVLAVSGCLDLAMGGPGYDLFGFIDDHSPHYLYEDYDPETRAGWRRSIYRFIVRSVPDPLMETLDCADPSQVVPARNTTITALQALALMNNKFVVSQAAHFADRLGKLAGTPEEHVQRAYELALGRPPAPREQEILLDYAQHYGWPNACRVLLNSNEIMFVD